MAHIVIRETTYPIEFDSLTVAELRFAATQTGADTREFLTRVNNLDVDALVAFAQIAMKRAGKPVQPDYFDDVPILSLVPQDDPEPEASPTQAASSGGEGKKKDSPGK